MEPGRQRRRQNPCRGAAALAVACEDYSLARGARNDQTPAVLGVGFAPIGEAEKVIGAGEENIKPLRGKAHLQKMYRRDFVWHLI